MTGDARRLAGHSDPGGHPDADGHPDPGGHSDPGGERQVPFFCPYCGEEELRPTGSKPGSWDCRSCARSFQLRFTGLVPA